MALDRGGVRGQRLVYNLAIEDLVQDGFDHQDTFYMSTSIHVVGPVKIKFIRSRVIPGVKAQRIT